jgi:iron complex outermembrane receptor protein
MNESVRRRVETVAAVVAAIMAAAVPAYAQQATNLGSVEAKALVGSQAGKRFASKVLTAKEKVKATQPIKSVPKFIFELVSPAGGGMQALGTLPNVYISGYNVDNASARNTISMRGVKVGWNSMPGDLETNAITAMFDGVPLNSLSEGTGWHSSEAPIGALMSGINVVEGPGNPRDRWYNSLGGTINFVPVQPTRHSGGRVSLSGGSFGSAIVSGVFNTGERDGWSTAMGGAAARSDSFRHVLGSNNLPSDSEQAYVKTRKRLASGSISFGAYYTRSDEWRPNMIPVTPVSTVAIAGSGAAGPLYSQQTSGFYSTLPRSVWWKHLEIADELAWSHLHLALSPSLELSNEAWFRIGKVRHYRINTYLGPVGSSDVEHYIERSKTFGDQLILDAKLASIDTLSFGGYVIDARATDTSDSSSTFNGSSLAQPVGIGYDVINSIDVAGFVQDEFRPIPALEIVPGLRLVDFITDFSNTSPTEACKVYPYMANPNAGPGQPAAVPSNCSYGPQPTFTDSTGVPIPWTVNYDTNPDQTNNLTATEPSLGVNYAVGGGAHLFGSYSITRHNPSAGKLDNYPIDVNTLKLARATTYDFGVRYLGLRVGGMRRIYAEVEYFHTLLDNQTQSFSFANDPYSITYFGYGSATLSGIDVVGQANIDRHWSAFANFGYLRSQWNSFTFPGAPSPALGAPNRPASYGANIPVSNSPKDNANFGASYRFLLPFATVKTTLWDQYTGIRYLWNNNARLPTNQSVPSYNLLNLSIRARILGSPIPGVTASEVSLQVLNLADTRYNSTEYISSGGYFNTSNGGYAIANPGSPRAIYLTVSADF